MQGKHDANSVQKLIPILALFLLTYLLVHQTHNEKMSIRRNILEFYTLSAYQLF